MKISDYIFLTVVLHCVIAGVYLLVKASSPHYL